MVVENFTLLFWVFVLFELFFQHGAGASKSYKPTIDPTPAVLHVGGGGGRSSTERQDCGEKVELLGPSQHLSHFPPRSVSSLA